MTSLPPSAPIRAWPAGTVSAWSCRPTRSAALALVDWIAALAERTGTAFRPGWSRAPIGTAKSSWRSCAATPTTRCSPANPPPTFRGSPAPDGCWRGAMFCIRPSPRITRTASRPFWKLRRPASSRCSGCFGMGEALYAGIVGAACPVRVYAPSVRTRTCSPIWCGGCWRMARTRASCIAWSIRRCRRSASSADPVAVLRGAAERRQSRASRCRRCSTPIAPTARPRSRPTAPRRRPCWLRSPRSAPAGRGASRPAAARAKSTIRRIGAS